MQVHEIRRAHPQRKKKLVARGGKRGKTAGRGGKGQTARAGNKRRPAMRDIIKKLPKLRGHGKNRAKSAFDRGPEAVVNVSSLNIFSAGEIVNKTTLIQKGLVQLVAGKTPKIKILGTGEITVNVTIEGCIVSSIAKEKIEKAGGNIVIADKTVTEIHADKQAKESSDKKTARAGKKSAKGGAKPKAKK